MEFIYYIITGLIIFVLYALWDKHNAKELNSGDNFQICFWIHFLLFPVAVIVDFYTIVKYYYNK